MVIGLLFNFVIMNGRFRGVMVVSVYVEEGEQAGCLAVKSLFGAPLNVNWILIDDSFISFWIRLMDDYESAFSRLIFI